jgi:hypothetical protein
MYFMVATLRETLAGLKAKGVKGDVSALFREVRYQTQPMVLLSGAIAQLELEVRDAAPSEEPDPFDEFDSPLEKYLKKGAS